MTATRRRRSNHTDVVVSMMQDIANGVIEPPAHVKLTARQRQFWDSIIMTKALDSWTPTDLIQAAHLARVLSDIEKYDEMIEEKTRLARAANGSVQVSPLHKIMIDLLAQSQTLCRTLQIHSRATHGESVHQKSRNTAHKELMRNMPAQGDSLIKRPVH